MGRDGVILDLRDNGGGHTSQLVVEKFAKRIVGWVRSRGYEPESYPLDSPRGPLVTVVDEQAGSDGDIATAAIKSLGLGPVVGTRTWGGVVGIDGRYTLVDGTMVTQPRYAFWLEGYDWGVENHGVDPDIEVAALVRPTSPPAVIPQLERAIEIALDELASNARQDRPRPRPLADRSEDSCQRPSGPESVPDTGQNPLGRQWSPSQRNAAITGAKRSMPPSATSASDTIAVCTPASANAR